MATLAVEIARYVALVARAAQFIAAFHCAFFIAFVVVVGLIAAAAFAFR